MNKVSFPIVLLLIFIWLVGLATIIISLKYQEGLIAILGVTAPYYMTKFLLVGDNQE